MDEMTGDSDHDMLFESDLSPPDDQDPSLSDGPQLRRPSEIDSVMVRIEAVFETIADALLNERADVMISLTANLSNALEATSVQGPKAIFTFPGKTATEAWRFCRCHEEPSLIPHSDLYYRDPALFGRQSTVDRYVDQIAAAFAVSRASLNVIAGVKGLMAGAAIIQRRDGSKIELVNVQSGILVPSMEDVLSVDLSRVRWVLVIEKEATFQSVISSEVWEEMMWHAVLVTVWEDKSNTFNKGKGYPDIATRAMTYFMSAATPRNGFAEPPVFGLVDYDPDGMAILHTYKHGSKNMSEENATIVVPTIRWMGLRSRDISDEDHTHRNQGLMPLTRRDRHKARKMLDWQPSSDHDEAAQWRRELQVMLMLNVKAELQIIDSDPFGLENMIRNAVSVT
ncbi:DNA topoisomerase IV, alpha subunit [Aureobasidium subglaciale]|nr:DNA topoisomerase IV, alpha subunit [Aureobasidium subglaciale]KAI5223180.1 DNA topoisomerase IV, alpha subunit [Aureobasidium subglaciale]KAI5259741.1 DNA topoisomerase IV, alpha subunit [Aureobasidium subglaciale]